MTSKQSTGNIENHYQNLLRWLVRIKYEEPFEQKKLLAGDSQPVIQILRYIFNQLSVVLTKEYIDAGYEVYMEREEKFVESKLKIIK